VEEALEEVDAEVSEADLHVARVENVFVQIAAIENLIN
jgi:hypothetical protein